MAMRQESAGRWALWRRALLVGAAVGLLTSPLGPFDAGLGRFVFFTIGATVLAAIALDVDAWARGRYRPPGDAPLPTLGFIGYGLLLSLFAFVMLISGPSAQAILLTAYAAAWWGVAMLLARGMLNAVVLALALMALPWGYAIMLAVVGIVMVARQGVSILADNWRFSFAALTGIALVVVPLTLIGAQLALAFRRESRRRRHLNLTIGVLPRSAR